jgi:hypothetical protein
MNWIRRAIGPLFDSHLFDAHLRDRKRSYALQSAMATLAMLRPRLVNLL